MKKLLDDTVDIPDYALSYLINGDASGLDEEDKRNADKFMKHYEDIAEKYNSSVIIAPEDYNEGSFCSNPAFGLPCNTFECRIIILVDNSYKI